MGVDFYTPGSMVPERSIGFLIRRIERLISPRAERAFADRELGFSQWVALNLIRFDLADSCSTLSRCLGHNSGATTRLIDQLEERGLVTRAREVRDRRVVTLALTDEGVRAVKQLTPRMESLWNDLLGDFDQGEVELLIGLLTRLLRTLEMREQAEARA